MKDTGNQILRTSLPLFSASFVAQIINFATLFLLPLLYPTEELGPYFVFSAVGMLLFPLISWRSFNTIVICHNERLASNNLVISLLIGGSTALVLYLIIPLLFHSPLMVYLTDWRQEVLFLPLYSFLGSSLLSFEYFLNFRKQYKQIGYSRVIKAVVTIILIVVFGSVLPTSFSIILSVILGQIGAIVFLFAVSGITSRLFKVRFKQLKIFLIRYRDILTYNTFLAVVSDMNNHLPVILLSMFYGDRIVAFYGLAQRIFSTPLGVFSQSISAVFSRKCVDYYNNARVFSFFVIDTLKKLLFVVIPFGALGFLLAPWIFLTFVGEEWSDAADIAQIIMPLIVLQNVVVVFTMLYTILNHQKRIFFFYLISFFIRIVLGFILPYFLFDMEYKDLLILFTISGILHYIVYFWELLGQVKRYETNLKFFKHNTTKQ